MRVVISGTASTRLSRVQRTSPSETTFEAAVLTFEKIDAALNGIISTNSSENASNGSNSIFQDRKQAKELGILSAPDPSAIVFLSPRDLCACGFFSCDIIQVAIRGCLRRITCVPACSLHWD